MSTVDKVIFDALAKRQNVVLPGVGSLEVKRRKAKKVSETRIIPPQNVVLFTPDEIAEAETAVYLLTATGGANEEEARALYDSWLESARSDKEVRIKDVGEIKEGKFVIAQPLHIVLNPANEKETVVVGKEKSKGGPLWIWILAGIVLAAVVLLLLSYFGKNDFLGIQKKPKVTETEIVVPVQQEPVVEEQTSEDVIIETLKKSGEHRFHVIAGSFSVEGNADDYIRTLQKQFPELSLEKIKNPRNGYWLVSILSAPTENQAYNKMNMYWDINLDLWVYEQK